MASTLINTKRAFVIGALIIVMQMGIFSALWLNPFVEGISAQFADHPSIKPYAYFGGIDNWMQLRTLYNIALLAILIKLYLMFYSNIPGAGWVKGLCFGLMISLIKTVPEAFNKWTLISYPDELILIQLINGSLGSIIFGVLVATLFEKFGVVNTAC